MLGFDQSNGDFAVFTEKFSEFPTIKNYPRNGTSELQSDRGIQCPLHLTVWGE